MEKNFNIGVKGLRLEVRAQIGYERLCTVNARVPSKANWANSCVDVNNLRYNLAEENIDNKKIVSDGIFNKEPEGDEEVYIDFEVSGTNKDWGMIYLSRYATASEEELLFFVACFKMEEGKPSFAIPPYEEVCKWTPESWKEKQKVVQSYFKNYFLG